jgi:hypothetical protein
MLRSEMRVRVPPEWLIRWVSVAESEAFIRMLRLGLAELPCRPLKQQRAPN